MDTITAIIKDVDDQAALAISLIENIQRENLNPIEEATADRNVQHERGQRRLQPERNQQGAAIDG